ncbi:hypothetical protein CCZ27_01585 [Thauera sinica]|nr:hypothetical protein CCZ27_01585 [Thauera sp. K11]
MPIVAGLGLLLLPAPFASAQSGGQKAARVKVEFVDPQNYTDVGQYGTDSDRNLAALARHLESEGQRCVAEGNTLSLRVLDVDLAGRNEWWKAGYDLRVMREIDWPRIKLHYVLRDAGGAIASEGDASVDDMNYLSRSAYVRADAIRQLPYERAMLRDWFERQFCRKAY